MGDIRTDQPADDTEGHRMKSNPKAVEDEDDTLGHGAHREPE